MKNRIELILVVVALFLSCATSQPSTKKSVLNKSKQKKRSESKVYQLIDTSKIYKLVALYHKHDSLKTNFVSEYKYKKYLKFYSNGRLAVYDDFDILTPDTLKAKVTDQGYYEYTYHTLYTKHFITNKDGKQFYNPQSHKFLGDTLLLYSESTKNTSYYLPISIPKTLFVNKADW